LNGEEKTEEKTVSHTKNKYPWSNYTLKLGRGEPVSTTQYVLYAVQIAAVIILSWLSATVVPAIGGISFFYFVYPFFLVFTMWWGIWGILGAYAGSVIGAGLLVGWGPVVSVAYSVGDIVPTLFAFVLYRGLLANRGYDSLWRDLTDKEVAGVKTRRVGAWVWFLLINGVVLNLLSGLIGTYVPWAMGVIAANAFWVSFAGWTIGDLVAMVIITPVLVKGLTSLVERQGLVNRGWIT